MRSLGTLTIFVVLADGTVESSLDVVIWIPSNILELGVVLQYGDYFVNVILFL